MTGDNQKDALSTQISLQDVQLYITAFGFFTKENRSIQIDWIEGEPEDDYGHSDILKDTGRRTGEVVAFVHTQKYAYSLVARRYDDNKRTTYLGAMVIEKDKYKKGEPVEIASGWRELANGKLVLGNWFRILRDMFANEGLS